MKSKRLRIPTGIKVEKTSFEGTPWYNLVGMKYLNKKYRNNCVVMPDKSNPRDHSDISLRWIQTSGTDGYIHIPETFWEQFEKHLNHSHNKQFILFPFGFTCKTSGGHATYMIYDIKNKILERFDSLGKVKSKCLNGRDVDSKIKKLFENKIGIKKYLKPFTEYKIFQEIQDAENESLPTDPKYGFCSVWAIFWADLRLSNPDISRDDLIKLGLVELINRKESLTQFIRNYSCILVKFGKMLKKKSRSVKK